MKDIRIFLGIGFIYCFCNISAVMYGKGKDTSVSFTLDELKCENLINPLGIDNTTPHFSWKLKGDGWKGGQAYYEIQVATDSLLIIRDEADLWKSGKLKSDASVMVPYRGSPLGSRSLCYWRVRVWDQKKKVSAWSSVVRFSVGLLDKNQFHGDYIGSSPEGGQVCAPLLRKKVRMDQAETAFLYVNSLGYHEIYVNGRKVSENVLVPAVSQLGKRSLILTYDITSYLKEGENDLLIWLGQGWYKKTTYGAAYDGPLVKAELDVLRNGRWEVLTQTDRSWNGCESGYSDTGNWCALQFGGEKVDGRILPVDLSSQSLDQRKWAPVVIVDVPDHLVSPQMCEANRIHRVLQPVSIKQLGEGTWLVDMGENQTGWFEMKMPVLPSGHEVCMEYSDNLNKEGEFDKQGESDIYISGGRQKECFRNRFNHHAFRYIRISNLPVKPEIGWMKSLQIYGDYPQTATFECSDADLNAIHDMIQYTMKCLTFSGYMVDCPHLERAGYGGDGNSSTMSLQTMYDVAPTFVNWLQGWGDSMQEGGSLPHVGPNHGADGGGPYWCGFIVRAPWRTYINYNDPRLIEKYYSQMKEWFKYVDKYTVGGLLKRWPDTQYRNWYLGDWLAPAGVDAGAQSSVDLVSNCFISECLDTMNKIALTLRKAEEAQEFANRKERLNQLIHQTFYRADEGIYSTGSQLDMCYPMLVGVVPDSLYTQVKKNMIAATEQKHNGHIAVGLVGVPILTEWAIQNKEADFFYQMMKKRDYPGYLYMIDKGATTTWEYWSGERSRIHNCYNGIGTWFYQAVGGIRPDETKPGYRHFYIDPQIPTGLTWAKVIKESPYGTIAVDWKLQSNQLNLRLTIPPGTTATVCMPDSAVSCRIDGRKVNVKNKTFMVEGGKFNIVFDLSCS
ncbi:family 78 glycoside hydrolase catalytic domain [Bacteroides faecichinchillae]|uniref:family 78 glycoside hydrolase catalytic domain n=1 Tax=Bacteroides faecichinchillae TaxID=871325 RepID=UPI0035141CE1